MDKRKEKIMRKCIICKKEISGNKYCQQCWLKKFNQSKRKFNYCKDCNRGIELISIRCKSCENKKRYKDPKNSPMFGKTQSLSARKKISLATKDNKNPMWGKTGKLAPAWRGGVSFEPYPLGWNKTFKEQIRYRDRYKCQICGCPEVENCRKLDVHHIDYIKENLDPKNLISLCRSCHAKTNFNEEYWIKYFKKE